MCAWYRCAFSCRWDIITLSCCIPPYFTVCFNGRVTITVQFPLCQYRKGILNDSGRMGRYLGRWSSLNSTVPSHLSVLLNTGRGISTETCGMDDVFVPDNLIGLFLILLRIVRLYMIYIWISLWCGMSFVYRCPTNWGRWPVLSVQWLPCQYLLDEKWLMYGILFSASICSQWYFCVRLFFLFE